MSNVAGMNTFGETESFLGGERIAARFAVLSTSNAQHQQDVEIQRADFLLVCLHP
jgi:hypothetical protein